MGVSDKAATLATRAWDRPKYRNRLYELFKEYADEVFDDLEADIQRRVYDDYRELIHRLGDCERKLIALGCRRDKSYRWWTEDEYRELYPEGEWFDE